MKPGRALSLEPHPIDWRTCNQLMRTLAIFVAALAAAGCIASVVAFVSEPNEAYFVFAALLGGISYLCIRRLRAGPSQTQHGLENARHPNVYAPNEPVDEGKPTFFGAGLPWFIGIVLGIIIAASISDFAWYWRVAGGVLGICAGTLVQMILEVIWPRPPV